MDVENHVRVARIRRLTVFAMLSLLKRLLGFARGYACILPVCCLLLFPVTCDASPHPHSVFMDPIEPGHAHHDRGPSTSGGEPILHEHHSNEMPQSLLDSCSATDADQTTTDIDSMEEVAGAFETYSSFALPATDVLLTKSVSARPLRALEVTELRGNVTRPASPPPRTHAPG